MQIARRRPSVMSQEHALSGMRRPGPGAAFSFARFAGVP